MTGERRRRVHGHGAVLGALVVIAAVSGIAMMGARLRQEPRREQLHPHLGQRPALSLTTSGYVGQTYSPLAATATSCATASARTSHGT
jgi:hypothetical protein